MRFCEPLMKVMMTNSFVTMSFPANKLTKKKLYKREEEKREKQERGCLCTDFLKEKRFS